MKMREEEWRRERQRASKRVKDKEKESQKQIRGGRREEVK